MNQKPYFIGAIITAIVITITVIILPDTEKEDTNAPVLENKENSIKHTHNQTSDIGRIHHEATIMIVINGNILDFSSSIYQQIDPKIHFEYHDGKTICRQSTDAQLGYLFETVGMDLTDQCLTAKKTSYCSSEDRKLQFFVNRQKISNLQNYVINSNDRILISFGNDELMLEDFFVQLDEYVIKPP